MSNDDIAHISFTIGCSIHMFFKKIFQYLTNNTITKKIASIYTKFNLSFFKLRCSSSV